MNSLLQCRIFSCRDCHRKLNIPVQTRLSNIIKLGLDTLILREQIVDKDCSLGNYLDLADLLGAVVDPEDEQQGEQVENSKQVLGQANIHPVVGDVIQRCESVHKSCWVSGMVVSGSQFQD